MKQEQKKMFVFLVKKALKTRTVAAVFLESKARNQHLKYGSLQLEILFWNLVVIGENDGSLQHEILFLNLAVMMIAA